MAVRFSKLHVAGICIVAMFLVLAGFVWMAAPRGGVFVSGEVIASTETTLVIRDDRGGTAEILIDGRTIIKRGRQSLAGVPQVGSRVIVSGFVAEDGLINARIVRLFDIDKGKHAEWWR